jgi:hypothetical protein
MTTTETHASEFFARATDSATGTLREEVGPFEGREAAEEALDELREKWTLATTFRVVARG